MGQGAPPRVITRTSGTVSVQLSRQPRVHPIASAIRSVRVSLTTDIAWSMASSIARLGQNWPVLAFSPSSTSVYPCYPVLSAPLSLSLSSSLFLFRTALSPSCFECASKFSRRSYLLSFFHPSFYPSRRRVAKRLCICRIGHVSVRSRSYIWGVQRRKKQVTK